MNKIILDESIESWENRVQTLRNNIGKPMPVLPMGSTFCPLCARFILYGCIGCPVNKKTGKADCVGTPYGDCVRLYEQLETVTTGVVAKFEKELSFLKSLRDV